MTPDDRHVLTGLFERIRSASGSPRDREAEAYIADAVREQPHAPYLMAQTVLVQEEALKAASARIQELEARLTEMERAKAEPATSFLGGIGKSMFGEAPKRTGSGVPAVGQGAPEAAQAPAPQGGVWGRGAPAPQQGFGSQAPQGQPGPWAGQAPAAPAGSSFLRSAMTTAAGVAGGALLFSGIQSLMNSHGSGIIPNTHGIGGDLAGASKGESFGPVAGSGLDDPNLMGSPPSAPAGSSAAFTDHAADHSYDVASNYDDGGGDFDSGGDWA